MNILLLEDDVALSRAIKRVLELDQHTVTALGDGNSVLESLDVEYDLYILDIKVPHVSGLELLELIMAQNKLAKVIIISVNTDTISLQSAYDFGCVDYLKKPFYIMELRAKINRLNNTRHHLLSSVRFKSDDLILTKKEKRLLVLLLENKTSVVTYEMIDESVYKNKSMSMMALRTLVRRLRAKLADDIIQNVSDQGYTVSIDNHSRGSNTLLSIKELAEENDLLKEENRRLKERSSIDPLTGLYNRTKINEIFAYEQQQFKRHKEPLSVVMLDLDNFKVINDTYGHNVGDNYLKEISRVLSGFFRASDTIGRWGGEEFIVLMPGTSLDESKEIVLKLRERINAIDCPRIGLQTASFGVAALHEEDTLKSFVHRADQALYAAKTNGKNRVEVSVFNSTGTVF